MKMLKIISRRCGSDGSLIYERVASRAELEARRAEAAAPAPAPAPPLKRRAYDDINGLDSQYRGRLYLLFFDVILL